MEDQPLDAEAAAKKARSKAAHRASMLATGFWMLGCGLVAAYLTFGRGGDLPAFMYGHLWRSAAAPLPVVRKPAAPSLVHWRGWDASVINEAKKKDRLIFLNLCTTWARGCHVMDETTYNDPGTAAYIEANFIPVRVDGDARPDLAARYFSGRPTTALLVPTGELADGESYMTPKFLSAWADTLAKVYRRERFQSPDALLTTAPRRKNLALVAPEPARDDPVWGGVFHGTLGDFAKILSDQAASIAERRTSAYVESFLSDPAGGFYASQSSELRREDGSVVEGEHYFAQDDAKRRALGIPAVDRRLFAAGNGQMAAAVLDAPKTLSSSGKPHALRTLERWWKDGVRQGRVRHELGAMQTIEGFLADQTGLAEGFAAAYEATNDKRELDRAAQLARWCESNLMDEKSQALFDRPATGELPPELDRLLVPRLNLEALVAYRRLVRDMPVGDPLRERLKARCKALVAWLQTKSESLTSAELAVLATDDYNGIEGKP